MTNEKALTMQLEELKDKRDKLNSDYNKADRSSKASAFGLLLGIVLFVIFGFSLIGGLGILLGLAGLLGAITQVSIRSSVSRSLEEVEEDIKKTRQAIVGV